MVTPILIAGTSGTGKTYSLRNLPPEKTFIICPDKKPLPFKGWKKNYKEVRNEKGGLDLKKSNLCMINDSEKIRALLKAIVNNKDVKYIILDTITLMSEAEYMDKAKEKGYEKFNDLAVNFYNLLTEIKEIKKDVYFIVMAHLEIQSEFGSENRKYKVIGGKLIGEKINPEAHFTIVLETTVSRESGESSFLFRTKNDGHGIAKSPDGMFEEFVENDMKIITDAIAKYENE